jgi:hypothetical protein
MKTIFTLLLATVFTSAFAYDEGRLTISVAVKNAQVYVDGRIYQDDDNNFVLNNIQPGNHTIKIYRMVSKSNGYGSARNSRKNVQKNELVYASTVYVRPSYHVDVMVNRFGKALVDEKAIANRNANWEDDDWNDGNSGYDNGGYNNGGYNNGYQQAMSDYDFNQLVQKIRNQWIGKIATARDAVISNYFNTGQVRQIMQLFSSESDKLDLAKISYKNVVDKQNFRQVYDLLGYQSQDELDRYVRDYR